jgi:pilus assembly protein TadC
MKELAVLGIGFVVLGLPFIYFYNDGKRRAEPKPVIEVKRDPVPYVPRTQSQLEKSVRITGEVVAGVVSLIVGVIAFVIVFAIFWNGQSGL